MVVVCLFFPEMNPKFSILVNTTDSFDDCWEPFFKLFKLYWPNYDGKIYLNTENKTFSYKDLRIISLQNGLTNGSWSECLDYAVNKIDEEYFIYLQEDYFFHNYVNHEKLMNFFNMMENNKFDCLHLTDQCSIGPFKKTNISKDFWEFNRNTPYRISTQAAFWNRKMILKVIRYWESGWDFEKFGTKRSKNKSYKIMSINHDLYKRNSNEIMPYIFTGIIKGKWKKEVIKIFDKHNIEIDYSLRGFSEVNLEYSLVRKTKSLKSLIYAYIKNFFMEKRMFFLRR